MEKNKKKIAVLGGGMSSMTAVYQLAQKDEYDITVYQMGWRLGGKGASGRKSELSDRIEEHGLHVWFGFYENAFNLMRQVYDELGRPTDAPLSDVDAAFKGVNELTMKELWKGDRKDWTVNFPHDKIKPGIGGPSLSHWSTIEIILKWVIEFAEGKIDGPSGLDNEKESEEHHIKDFPDWIRNIIDKTEHIAGGIIKSELWFLKTGTQIMDLSGIA